VSEYVVPGVYDEGNPFIVGTIIASVLWHVQPLALEPVLPVELASIAGTDASIIIIIRTQMNLKPDFIIFDARLFLFN
jgi:hypothetical protein|tara:strand:- start:185 stop:418 length:234 start_codon:yes stop_codon:yes gene_type:complete